MRRVGQLVQVEAGPAGRPRAVAYPYRRQVLAWLKRWRSKGRWLFGEGPRAYWLVELEGGLVLELYCEEGTGQWIATRQQD